MLAERPDRVKRYVEETGLPFYVLVDETRDVARAYGVWHRLGLDAWNIARPAAFLIDRDGFVRYAFVGRHQADFPEYTELLDAVGRVDRRG